ncbi:NUC153 domain protein [Theileria parva strain Muguga]|uniref:NUC153 domain protein n=1 Tax=Theileria parva strain Muguga TaxID=333668 RepID=UPI001C620337|nr:NUC153 domain protein [Theileria parva strain Muguga]EAN30623.2 NUC153 domain protein [Theileria parva strain Muguga]
MTENSPENEVGDERFKLKARFRKKKEKTFEKDERFDKVLKEDVKSKTGPKIDPFGRPLDDTSINEIYSSSDEEDLEEGLDSSVKEEKEPIEYGEESDRIAVIGCDWDNITADDLFVLFETIYRSITNNNFVTAVKRAAIYLSDIGEKKISEENVSGPSIENDTDKRDEEDDDETRQEALRKYQKERSRYYYGVVELNSVEKAKILYDELDGTEVSFAIDGLDLRFVPASLEFPRKPTSESFKIPDNYQPPVGSQSALRHSKVECKWDITPAKRFKTLTKRFTEQELASLDLSEYLASDDSENDVEEENVSNYKRLVKEVNMESDTEDDDKEGDYSESLSDEDEDELENDGNEHISATVGNFKISFGPDVAIPTEEVVDKPGDYNGKLKKKKNKFKNKRGIDEHTIEGRHFDMRYLKSKKHQSKLQQPGFQSNFDDERLKKVFQDPKFEIDTTDPNYKKTEFNQKLLELKSKRKN